MTTPHPSSNAAPRVNKRCPGCEAYLGSSVATARRRTSSWGAPDGLYVFGRSLCPRTCSCDERGRPRCRGSER